MLWHKEDSLPAHCGADRARPRVYAYDIPAHIAPAPTRWRLVRGLLTWLQASRFYERDGDCADYFLVPTHPNKNGDAGVSLMFDYIRSHHPFWNRTQRLSQARHLLMLPCDHGAGDCAYSRPMVPNKYTWIDQSAGAPVALRAVFFDQVSVHHLTLSVHLRRCSQAPASA